MNVQDLIGEANVSAPMTIRVSDEVSRAAQFLEGAVAPCDLVAVAQALAHLAPALWGHHQPGAGRQLFLSSAQPIRS